MHRLELENFYSIRERQVIDLRIAGNVPDPEHRFAEIPGGRVPQVVAFFGANAAGKSNVLRGLALVAWFVQHSFQLEPGAILPFQRFAARDMADKPTVLAIQFAGPREFPSEPRQNDEQADVSLVPYRYEVAFRNAEDAVATVLHERLEFWPTIGGRSHSVFRRDENGKVMGSKMFPITQLGPALRKVRANASVVSTLSQFEHPPSLALRAAAARIFTNILIERHEFSEQAALQLYLNNPSILEALNSDLERIDVGIREVTVASGQNGPVFLFEHRGLDYPLPIHLESHGTRQFLRIFPAIRAALETGGIAALDELDLAIHPLVLPEILRWFTDSRRNPHGAQIWFTCQNAALLDFLDKEEIFFCEKDGRGRSIVYGLRDVQDVRRSDNFAKKYLGGRYGAVPRFG